MKKERHWYCECGQTEQKTPSDIIITPGKGPFVFRKDPPCPHCKRPMQLSGIAIKQPKEKV